MPTLKKLWIGPLVGFLIGFTSAISNSSDMAWIAGCILALFALIFQLVIQYFIKSRINAKYGFLKREEGFIQAILILAAEMAKADGTVSASELALIENRIRNDFENKGSEKHVTDFHTYLNQANDIHEICQLIQLNFDKSAKAHLIYLLIAIATADGILSESEIDLLKKICSRSSISVAVLVSTLKLFQFEREGYSRRKDQSNNKRNVKATKNELELAYEIIGVTATTSADGIKSAYRKLAKLHHPDKVAHLGENVKRSAAAKFKEIANAYAVIKTARNFK